MTDKKQMLLEKLDTLYMNLLIEANEAKKRGGTQAMKIASRVELIKDVIDFIHGRN